MIPNHDTKFRLLDSSIAYSPAQRSGCCMQPALTMAFAWFEEMTQSWPRIGRLAKLLDSLLASGVTGCLFQLPHHVGCWWW